MTRPDLVAVVNTVANQRPVGGHQMSFVRLDGTRRYPLGEIYDQAMRLASQLTALGLRPGDRIGILAANCLEWVLLDLAALRLKLVVAGFEPAKFTADAGLIDRYQLAMLFTDRPVPAGGRSETAVRPISELTELIGQAEPAEGTAPVDPAPAEPPPVEYGPDEVITLKFTSGSSGQPKGLAATVGSVDSSISAVQAWFGHGQSATGDDLFVFLPLSLLQQRYWVYSAMCFGHDLTISTYEAAFPVLRTVRPTVVMGVPGFYETARKHIEAQARRAGPDEPVEQALGRCARALFGDRIRYLWTGSAPAAESSLRFYAQVGLPIYEGYGLNETCIVAKNHPAAHRPGSVGQLLPGKQVIFDADGVISVRSDFPVNRAYAYAAPGDSERVFGPDGLVRTGDLGYLDADGFLFIKGRADDVIVLDNGKKIIVGPIEQHLKASPAIEECVLFCPTQTHLVAVVSPATEPADELAIQAHVAASNAQLAADERIAKVVLAESRFTVDNGLLSEQFKPRRKQILQRYRAQIDA